MNPANQACEQPAVVAAELRAKAQAIYDREDRTLGESARALELVAQATEIENRANIAPQTTRSALGVTNDYRRTEEQRREESIREVVKLTFKAKEKPEESAQLSLL